MGLQKGDIWCHLEDKELKAFPGYYVDDGILAVYCAANGTWTVGHVPSGYSIAEDLRTRKGAVEFARRIRPLEIIDWYALSLEDLRIPFEISPKVHEVGHGAMTIEGFNVWVMMHKMGGINE